MNGVNTLPFTSGAAITPSDTVSIAAPQGVDPTRKPDAIFVGGAGNVVAVFPSGLKLTFNLVPAGTILPIAPKRIDATDTTATGLLALYRI